SYDAKLRLRVGRRALAGELWQASFGRRETRRALRGAVLRGAAWRKCGAAWTVRPENKTGHQRARRARSGKDPSFSYLRIVPRARCSRPRPSSPAPIRLIVAGSGTPLWANVTV